MDRQSIGRMNIEMESVLNSELYEAQGHTNHPEKEREKTLLINNLLLTYNISLESITYHLDFFYSMSNLNGKNT